MICKCGATVKASANKTGITPIMGVRHLGPKGGLRADLGETLPASSNVRPVPARPLQELGAIEAGSKVEITASWKE
jgi:hypothetical protein